MVFTSEGQKGLLEGLAKLRELEQERARALGESRMRQLRTALLALHDHLESE